MAGFGRLHGVHRERADGVRKLGFRSGRNGLRTSRGHCGGKHGDVQIILSAMIELPSRAPAHFEPLCFTESAGEGHWFAFCGDKLLVELGPLDKPSDDPRFRARPAWARLPAKSDLCKDALRTLYLGRLNGVDCWAAELAADAPAPAGLSWEGLRPLRYEDRAQARGARPRLPRLQAFGLPESRPGGDGSSS